MSNKIIPFTDKHINVNIYKSEQFNYYAVEFHDFNNKITLDCLLYPFDTIEDAEKYFNEFAKANDITNYDIIKSI